MFVKKFFSNKVNQLLLIVFLPLTAWFILIFANFSKLTNRISEWKPVLEPEPYWKSFFLYLKDISNFDTLGFLACIFVSLCVIYFLLWTYGFKQLWSKMTLTWYVILVGNSTVMYGFYETNVSKITERIAYEMGGLTAKTFMCYARECTYGDTNQAYKYYRLFPPFPYHPSYAYGHLQITTDFGTNWNEVTRITILAVLIFGGVFISIKFLKKYETYFALALSLIFAIAPLALTMIIDISNQEVEKREQDSMVIELCTWANQRYAIPGFGKSDCYDLAQSRESKLNIFEVQKNALQYRDIMSFGERVREFGFLKGGAFGATHTLSVILIWDSGNGGFKIVAATDSGEIKLDSNGNYMEIPLQTPDD